MAEKMGRPLKEIDWVKVEKLCFIHCTGEEIAAIIEVDYDTLVAAIEREYKQTFSEYFKKHSSGGRASLRRMQFKAAESGNTTMLVWLGKQHLGQKDRMDYSSEDGSMTPKGFNDFYDDKEAES